MILCLQRSCQSLRFLFRCKRYEDYRVPDLQLDLFAVYIYHACPKLNSNGEIVYRLKALVCELQQQT